MSLAGLLMAGGGMGAQGAAGVGQQMMGGAQQPQAKPSVNERLMGLLGDPKMHIALSLLESGGWQQQPISLGQAMARAGVAGANAIQMQQKMDMDRAKAQADADAKVARAKRDNAQAGYYEAQAATAGRTTLRPGDTQIDADGKVIGSAPSRRRVVRVKNTLVDVDTSEVLYEAPGGGFTLGPGQGRYDENGALIASAEPAPIALGERSRLVNSDGSVVHEATKSARSPIGRLEQDYRDGIISKEERDAGVAKANMASA
jgi:hypothetical protein